MTHCKKEIRTLQYQGYCWPVVHCLAPSWKDEKACFACSDAEWDLSDDDLIEKLILEGVILHNNAGEYNEEEIYTLEVHNKGVVTRVSGYFSDGLWFQGATNLPLVGRIVVKEYGRDEFMAYFRGDRMSEELSTDDCIEIFLGVLKGSSDITKGLLEELCSDYNRDLNKIVA